MEAGIIGVAGAVVGGLITGGFSVFRDWRQDRREAKRGVRLAWADLVDMKSVVDEALEQGKWPEGQGSKNWSASWVTYSGMLAGAVDPETFGYAAVALGRAPALQSGLAAGDRPFREPKEDQDKGNDRLWLESVQRDLQRAVEELLPRVQD